MITSDGFGMHLAVCCIITSTGPLLKRHILAKRFGPDISFSQSQLYTLGYMLVVIIMHACPVVTLQISISESGSMTSQLSLATYYGLVKLLATCAASSAVVSQSLLEVSRLHLSSEEFALMISLGLNVEGLSR